MLKFFNNEIKNKLTNISDKLCSNEIVCNQILQLLNNSSTNVKSDKDIKNSYYVFLNDTIYLSCSAKNTNDYQRICVIAHECIHSIQSKLLQITNFILSNIELIYFLVVFMSILLNIGSDKLKINYLIINLISFIPRLILEVDAVIRSISVSEKYLKNNLSEEEKIILIKNYKIKTIIALPLFILSLFFLKIFRFIFVCVSLYF